MTSPTHFESRIPLDEQVERVKDAIRNHPEQANLRTFYFQLLAVLGHWDKALKQLQVCAQLDPQAAPMAHAYREAMRCELLRQEVFAGRKTPFILGEPPQWISYLIDALKAQAEGAGEAALELRMQALDMAPALAGRLNDEPFEWLCDSDSRLGPVCELHAKGCYYWVPFSAVRSIAFEKPQDLRDMVWQPCEITLANGNTLQGLIPTRYPLSAIEDDALRLARRTEWVDLAGDHVAGRGQRVLLTDRSEHALLDVRSICFDIEA